jgi:transposase
MRGKPLIGMVSGRKFKRTGIVAAQLGKTIIEPLQYSGTMDSALFEAWFETRLLPSIPINTLIVMDNATFHRKRRLVPLAEQAGVRLLFLPPYSPNLNPIEHFWGWLKRHLRKILPDHCSFDSALHSAFQVC